MPRLIVRISKRTDGGAVLKCVRPDGSETWQKQEGKQAEPRPLTDDELARVRQRRAELFSRWADVKPGDVLELTLP